MDNSVTTACLASFISLEASNTREKSKSPWQTKQLCELENHPFKKDRQKLLYKCLFTTLKCTRKNKVLFIYPFVCRQAGRLFKHWTITVAKRNNFPLLFILKITHLKNCTRRLKFYELPAGFTLERHFTFV